MSSSSSSSIPTTTTTDPAPPFVTNRPTHAWCCTAILDATTKEPRVTYVAGDNNDNDESAKDSSYYSQALLVSPSPNNNNESVYDITESPGWMEWIEVTEGRSFDEGGAGAYDTMRCDLIVKEPSGKHDDDNNNNTEAKTTTRDRSCVVWGEEYHLKRLQNSFLSLLSKAGNGTPDTSTPTTLLSAAAAVDDDAVEIATKDSHALLRVLMEEAKSSCFLKRNSIVAPGEKDDYDHTWIQLIKLTLLWSLPKNDSNHQDNNNLNNNNNKSSSLNHIVVRGHACSTGKPLPVFRSIQPIVVTVAALGHKDKNNINNINAKNNANAKDAKIDTSLPTRFDNPQSKVASWCKQRKKMDNPETYKPPGVSEVLMVRPTTSRGMTMTHPTNNNNDKGDTPFSSLELMEGLSSNVFVIYKDGTLRTAQEGVLFGYVRNLVLAAAPKCGLLVDTKNPITLQDAIDGKWSEVFITSSSRLIWPISRILLPSRENENYIDAGSKSSSCSSEVTTTCEIDGFAEFWSDPILTGPGVPVSTTPQWQELLEEILHSAAGYKR